LLSVLVLSFGVAGAEAAGRPFLPGSSFSGEAVPGGSFEGACGIALDSFGEFYVSSYYRHAVEVMTPGSLITEIAKVDPSDGPCGLALTPSGVLYANDYHEDVVALTPSSFPPERETTYTTSAPIDSNNSTGVALDPATGDLYIDDRTYIAKYEAPIVPGAEPVQKIGLGTLEDGYGLALSTFAASKGRLYVPDAASDTVKVYDPAADPVNPIAEIDGAGTPQGGFHSLRDSAAAIDPTNGHLLVADNLQPGFEAPAAVIDEFNAQGEYSGQLPHAITDAEPPGIVIGGGGDAYVTSGNAEGSQVYAFGPPAPGRRLEVTKTGAGEGTLKSEPAGIECGSACAAEYDAGATVTLSATPAAGSAFAGWSGCAAQSAATCTVTMGVDRVVQAEFQAAPAPPAIPGGSVGQSSASARTAALPGSVAPRPPASPGQSASASETTQKGSLRVSFEGQLSPHALPRSGQAPVHAAVGTKIAATGGGNPPQLRQIQIAINRNGHFDPTGLPVCPLEEIQPSTTANALKACRGSLIGEGLFEAKVLLSQQSPFPSRGKVYAFNSVLDGHPAILAHVYGTKPVPTSFTLPFELHSSKGTFGTTLVASLPEVTGNSAYVTGISLKLFRRFSYRGESRSYISAGCPAPEGFSKAVFPFARVSLAFKGGRKVRSTLTRSCGVEGS
jgi:DNA-binding beta-propeller fold protein YncE